MAIIDKLNYLNETKTQIKNALNDLGAEITNNTFRNYVTKINNLYEEYPSEEQVSSLQSIQPLQQPLNLQPLENIQIEEEQQTIEEPQEESEV